MARRPRQVTRHARADAPAGDLAATRRLMRRRSRKWTSGVGHVPVMRRARLSRNEESNMLDDDKSATSESTATTQDSADQAGDTAGSAAPAKKAAAKKSPAKKTAAKKTATAKTAAEKTTAKTAAKKAPAKKAAARKTAATAEPG